LLVSSRHEKGQDGLQAVPPAPIISALTPVDILEPHNIVFIQLQGTLTVVIKLLQPPMVPLMVVLQAKNEKAVSGYPH